MSNTLAVLLIIGSAAAGFVLGANWKDDRRPLVALQESECPAGTTAAWQINRTLRGGFMVGGITAATVWECEKP